MSISTNGGKSICQIQNLPMVKTLRKLRMEVKFLILIKDISKNPELILNLPRNDKCFLPKFENKAKMSVFTPLI